MPKFIKLTNIEKDCSHLNICIDSIEHFHRFHPKFSNIEEDIEEEHTRIYFKGNGCLYRVSETPEEIEALINETQLHSKEVIPVR